MVKEAPEKLITWLGALLLALVQPNAWAALDEELLPLRQDSMLSGKLGAIGMVVAGNGARERSMATGFLVSPCHVLTAAHVLAQTGESAKIGTALRFLPEGVKKAAFFERAIWGQVVAASSGFIMKEGPGGFDLQTIQQDWALIELDRAIPNVEPFKLLFPGADLSASATFSVVGYPAGAAGQRLHVQEHCLNRSFFHGAKAFPGVVFADCAVRPGMSGGPLLIDSGIELVAAGIVVERFEIGGKVMAVAVPTHAFAEQINQVMRSSDICAVGLPFVWPPVARAQ